MNASHAQNPLVSICITTYNRKSQLLLALNSILSQTYKNIEVIIVDDCSTDGTRELVEHELLKIDKRVRYIRHSENKGLPVGRNNAIYAARGKYFSFCDDDDEWLPNYIEEFVRIAEGYDDSYCFCCGFNLKIKMKDAIYKGYTPPVAAQFYFLSTMKAVNGYDERIKSGVDHDLWLTLAHHGVSLIGLDQELSLPNINLVQHRMTTDKSKRVNNIKSSFKIWRSKYEPFYDEGFFDFFESNYFFYIYKKLARKALKENDYVSFIRFVYRLDVNLLLVDVKGKLLGKRRNTLFFPWK